MCLCVQLSARLKECDDHLTEVRNEYLLALAAVNVHHQHYYTKDVPYIMEVRRTRKTVKLWFAKRTVPRSVSTSDFARLPVFKLTDFLLVLTHRNWVGLFNHITLLDFLNVTGPNGLKEMLKTSLQPNVVPWSFNILCSM